MISLKDNFSYIREKGPVLVAVSGGSDSMALLFLANAWAKSDNREIHAVTVDHGLRPEAAAEAAFVAMVCDGLGVVHTTLAWDGIKPSAGISEAARNARYDLIEEFAGDIGVRVILSGHTRDDQAETVMMRLGRNDASNSGSGRGHSGMCKRTLLAGGTMLMRPLLKLSRKQLRSYLNDISQSWIEDPSNHDESYERVRVRAKLDANLNFKDQLINYAEIMGRMREIVARDAAILLNECCTCERGHLFQLDTRQIMAAPALVGSLAIKTVIAAAGGAPYMISDLKLAQVIDLIAGGYRDCITQERITLGNCIIEVCEANLQIFREARNLNSTIVEEGRTIIWDGRVHVTNDSEKAVRIEPVTSNFMAKCNEDENCELNRVRKALLISSPLITTSSGVASAVFFDRSKLPAQIDIRYGSLALENFCPEWEFCLLDWLKSIDLDIAKNMQNSSTISRMNKL